MEFCPNAPGVFATGSMDKQIKLWHINNIDSEIDKMKYMNGVGMIKWRVKEPEEFCVGSLSGDSTLTIWNKKNPYHPKYVLRGHDDVVTSCNFDRAE